MILGTEYEINQQTLEENKAFEDCDGYCDPSVKKIFYRKYENQPDSFDYLCRDDMQKKTLRHEIVHAFMYESGLWRNAGVPGAWSMNEEMVDWIAIQFPKIAAVYEQLGIL